MVNRSELMSAIYLIHNTRSTRCKMKHKGYPLRCVPAWIEEESFFPVSVKHLIAGGVTELIPQKCGHGSKRLAIFGCC